MPLQVYLLEGADAVMESQERRSALPCYVSVLLPRGCGWRLGFLRIALAVACFLVSAYLIHKALGLLDPDPKADIVTHALVTWDSNQQLGYWHD